MSYYLEDHPNVPGRPAQYGWPRTRVSGVIGVHTTESGVVFSGADPGAENTARFISTRSDHGSYHIMADWDTIVPLTRPTFAAWADTTNNAHAMSVSGAMNAARWRDLAPARASQIVRNMGIAAAMLVRDAIAHGVLSQVVPAQRITAAEAIAGTRMGFYGHGETNPGTRYDPGTNFDWDLFLSSYAAAVGGSIQFQSATIPEEDMPLTKEDVEWIAGRVAEVIQPMHDVDRDYIPGAVLNKPVPYKDPVTGQDTGQTTTLATMVGFADFQAVQTRSLVQQGPAQIAEQINAAGLASAVRDELVKLLEGK